MKYYVYVLFNKQNEEVFYVGKGQDFRIHAHKGDKNFTDKTQKIKQLQERDLLGERIIGRFVTEAEALSVEATLIKWVYGFNKLTNLNRGYRNYNIRENGDFREIPGIDVEKVPNVQDGSYTKGLTEKLIKNQVVEKLSNVHQIAKSVLSDDYDIQEPDISYPQDPTQWIYKSGWPARVRLKVGPAGKQISPAFFLVSKTRRKEFVDLIESLGCKVSVPKGDAFILTRNLASLPNTPDSFTRHIKVDDNDAIAELVINMTSFLNKISCN